MTAYPLSLTSLVLLAACGGGGGRDDPVARYFLLRDAEVAQFATAEADIDLHPSAPSGDYNFSGYARFFGATAETTMDVVTPARVTGNFSDPAFDIAFGEALARVNDDFSATSVDDIRVNDPYLAYNEAADNVFVEGRIEGSVSAGGHMLTYQNRVFGGNVTQNAHYIWAETYGVEPITIDGVAVTSGGFRLSGEQ